MEEGSICLPSSVQKSWNAFTIRCCLGWRTVAAGRLSSLPHSCDAILTDRDVPLVVSLIVPLLVSKNGTKAMVSCA
jgi:hypothetical protein